MINRLRGLPRNLWVMTLASLLTDISSDMVNNLIPFFLANALGARTGVVGLVEGIAESVASLLKLVSGWLSDRVPSRKGLTVSGYGLSTLAKPFLYLATTWGGVLGVRFVDRVGKGIRTSPRDALLADSVPPEQRGRAFGLHRAGDSLGAAIGLGLALLIVWSVQGGQLELTRAAFQRVVVWSIIPAALAVVVLAVGVVEVRRVAPQAGRPRLSPLHEFSPDLRRFLLVMGLFTLGNSSDAFILLRAQERGLSVAGVLAMLLTFNLVYTLVAGPAGALSDRIGQRRLILIGWLAYVVIYLGLALSQTVWQVWLLFLAYGAYYGLVEGNARAYVAGLAGPERRGAAFGVYHALIGLLALPASLLAGVLWQGVGAWSGFGPSAPFVFGAVMALLAAAIFAVSRPSSVAPAEPRM